MLRQGPVYLEADELADLRRRVAELGTRRAPALPAPSRSAPPRARSTGSGLAQLTWRRGQGNGVEQADAPGGRYLLTANMGRWDLCWLPVKGRVRTFLGGSLHREEAEKMAEQDLLTRMADAALKNAGHGELTGKGVTGPAEKWTPRRRRG